MPRLIKEVGMLTDILVNFTHAAVVVFGLLTLLWAISLAARDASLIDICLLYTSPSPRDGLLSRMPSSA